MFTPTKSWVDKMLPKIVRQWGYFPELEPNDVLLHLGSHTYNLKAAQKAIEKHLWAEDVDADVTVKFVHLPIPGLIKSYQSWHMGKIQLKMEIEVSEDYRHNPVDQMNILAHEYAHAFHFLRADFVSPSDNVEYEHLTDLSTIALGMGRLTLQGRGAGVERYGVTNYIGYMPLDLLVYAQKCYEKLKGRIPPVSLRPRTTIRPGRDKEWVHEEIPFTPPEPLPNPPKPKHWESNNLFATIGNDNKIVPLKEGEIIGRSFAKAHDSSNTPAQRVSREQLIFRIKNKKLVVKNIGKHPIELTGKRNMKILGIIPLNVKAKWTINTNEEVLILQPHVDIVLPNKFKFRVG